MAASARGEANSVMGWLVGQWHWPAACLFAAGVMLLTMPVWAYAAGTALALVFLQLPIYMVHEFEEHTGDRFRKYLNRNVAGCEALTPGATFWINAVGVWGLELVALYLAAFVDLSFGLVAFYLPLVNALTHVREAVVRREYNPGLWTAVVLFLPISGWGKGGVAVGLSLVSWTMFLMGSVMAGKEAVAHLRERFSRQKARPGDQGQA